MGELGPLGNHLRIDWAEVKTPGWLVFMFIIFASVEISGESPLSEADAKMESAKRVEHIKSFAHIKTVQRRTWTVKGMGHCKPHTFLTEV